MKMAITRKFVAISQFGFFSMAAMLASAAVAQQQAPSPEQAPMVLSTLDADGDVKISESEATGGLKQNFVSIDRNGDGGIDGDRPIQRCRTILGSCVRELTQRS